MTNTPVAPKEPFFEKLRETFLLRAFGFVKIPLIWWVGPSVIHLSADRCEIKIPLGRRTRNHLGSMYFGVLCTGADVAGGLVAMKLIRESGQKISLVFQDFSAEFLKRPDADVVFRCDDGPVVRELVAKAVGSSERVSSAVTITAHCPSKYGDEVMARFKLTISLKKSAKTR